MGERVHWRGAWHRCRPHFFSGDEVVARSLRLRYRRRGRGEEKEKWSRVFGGGAAGRAFDAPSCALHRSIETDGHERLGQRRSPGGKGREAEFPAQAQVAAWTRGCARARGWAAAAGPGVLARARVSRPWAARVLAGPKWPNE